MTATASTEEAVARRTLKIDFSIYTGGDTETMTDYRAFADNLTAEAVSSWFSAQCKNPYGAFYIWHRPGAVRIAEEKPGKDWELSDPRRIHPLWTKEQAMAHCRAIVYRSSILLEGEG